MTRETKIGLLLGMGVILLIGIIVSDHLGAGTSDDPADFTGFAADAHRSINATDAIPAHPPAGPAQIIDPSRQFFPDDLAPPLPLAPQAQLEPAPESTAPGQPLIAANVGELPAAQRQEVPTLTVGNEPTALPHITAAPSLETGRTDAPPRSPSVIRHTVRSGETLTKIAQRYYGNGDYWRAIAQANPSTVTRAGRVRQGVVLDIPKRADAALGPDFIPVDIRAADRDAPAAGGTIKVVAGDTLSELAAKHMGSAGKWRQLLEANSDTLDDPQDLRVGMKLRVPGLVATVVDRSDSDRTTRPSSGGKTYTVRAGDNLTQIARKTLGDGSRWDDIYQANRNKLSGPDKLVVGQELLIPG